MQITLAVKDLAMGEWMEQHPVKLPKVLADELNVIRGRYRWGMSTVIRIIVEKALPLISSGSLRLIEDQFNRVPGEESNQSVPGVPKIPPMRRGDSAASPEELDLRGRRRVLAFSRLTRRDRRAVEMAHTPPSFPGRVGPLGPTWRIA